MEPFELTPAGTHSSRVNFDKPGLDRFPLFERALETAMTVDLSPATRSTSRKLAAPPAVDRPDQHAPQLLVEPPQTKRGRRSEAFLQAMLSI